MKFRIYTTLGGLALCLAAFVSAAPPPITVDLQAAMDKTNPRDTYHTFKVLVSRRKSFQLTATAVAVLSTKVLFRSITC